MKYLYLCIFSILTLPCFGQRNDSVSINLTQELEEIYKGENIVGFSVAIVDQESIKYSHGFGYADIKSDKKYTEHTTQPIGSISKTFIGVALLKAHELGLLDLDDPINQYLPFEVINPFYPYTTITIRHLATHTSSIKDPIQYVGRGYVLLEKENKGVKKKINFRSKKHIMDQNLFLRHILNTDGNWYKKGNFLNHKPGEVFEYSNVAAGLAAYVLENATQESFDQFTSKHIFEPLDMNHTGWFAKDIDSSFHSKLYSGQKKELAPYQLVNYPDGGLMTSSTDLGKYLSELVAGFNGQGKILSSENFSELFKPQLSDENYSEGRKTNTYNDEYNMGIFMGQSSKGQLGHTGGDPGVVTLMFFNSQSKKGKILMSNTDLNKEGIQQFKNVWKKLAEYENKL